MKNLQSSGAGDQVAGRCRSGSEPGAHLRDGVPVRPGLHRQDRQGRLHQPVRHVDLTDPRLKRAMFLGTRWGDEGAKFVPAPGDPYYLNYTYDPLRVGMAPPPAEAAPAPRPRRASPLHHDRPVLPMVPAAPTDPRANLRRCCSSRRSSPVRTVPRPRHRPGACLRRHRLEPDARRRAVVADADPLRPKPTDHLHHRLGHRRGGDALHLHAGAHPARTRPAHRRRWNYRRRRPLPLRQCHLPGCAGRQGDSR